MPFAGMLVDLDIGGQRKAVPVAGRDRVSEDGEDRDLVQRFERLAAAELLGARTARAAALQFHALCEGLTALELRGMLGRADGERLWREGVGALVAGFDA